MDRRILGVEVRSHERTGVSIHPFDGSREPVDGLFLTATTSFGGSHEVGVAVDAGRLVRCLGVAALVATVWLHEVQHALRDMPIG